MNKIFLVDNRNKKVEVSLVRFFQYNDNQYLIYTLGEEDDKDYIKLYMVKIMNEFGRSISYHIVNDNEWDNIKTVLKMMLKEIKSNEIVSFNDLNPEYVNNLKINEARVFKFDAKLVDLFSKNVVYKKEEKKLESVVPEKSIVTDDKQNSESMKNEPAIDVFKNDVSENYVDYKKLYNEEKDEIERLNKLLTDKIEENIQYKILYGELK